MVAQFSSEDLSENILTTQDGLSVQLTVFEDDTANIRVQEIENINSAQLVADKLAKAKIALQKWEEADKPMNIRQAQLDLETAQSELQRAERRHEDLKKLIKDGFITADELEEGRIRLEEARVDLETKEKNQELLQAYSIPQKDTELKNAVMIGTSEVEKNSILAKTSMNKDVRAEEAARRKHAHMMGILEDLKAEKDGYTITAPSDGIVRHGSSRRYGSFRPEIGTKISAGQVLMTIPDLSSVEAELMVPEVDIRKIKLGMNVFISADAVSDQTYKGTVKEIAELASSGSFWSGSSVKEFEVEVSIPESEGLKPGYSCEAEFVVEEATGVLQVPIQAVFRDGEDMSAYVVKNGEIERRMVKMGRSSLTAVEILEGVAEGERVRVVAPDSGDSE